MFQVEGSNDNIYTFSGDDDLSSSSEDGEKAKPAKTKV